MIRRIRQWYRDAPIGRKLYIVIVLASVVSSVLSVAGVTIWEFRSDEDLNDLEALIDSKVPSFAAAIGAPDFSLSTVAGTNYVNDSIDRDLHALGKNHLAHAQIVAVLVSKSNGQTVQYPPLTDTRTQQKLAALATEPRIAAAFTPALDRVNQPIAAAYYIYTWHKRYVVVKRPLTFVGQPVGYVNLLAETQYFTSTHVKTALLAAFLTGLIALFFCVILRRSIAIPIERVARVVDEVARRDYDVPELEKYGNDETGQLIDAFNRMVQKIKAGDAEIQLAIAELRTARDRAQEANRLRLELVAKMNHELRNPLNAIIGFPLVHLNRGQDRFNQEQAWKDMKTILAQGRYMQIMIDSLLELSKIEAGQMKIEQVDTDVPEIVGELQDMWRILFELNGNQFLIDVEQSVRKILSDPVRLKQILINLIGNANKFTKNGTITLTVRRVVRNGAPWIACTVKDSGIGINPEQRKRLFSFFAADPTTVRKYGGSGLGLAISYELALLMKGDIAWESQPGKGAEFTVNIPLCEPDAPTLQARVEPAPSAVVRPSRERKLMLVIDDDPSVARLVEAIVEPEGLEVRSAHSGEEGLVLARSLMPDVIVLDVIMPGMNGWAVLTTLKADPVLSHIAVVLMTVVDDRKRAYALGASDFLIKPIDHERLVSIARGYRSESSPTVLVIEDSSEQRKLVRELLQAEEWTVAEAENGAEALNWLAGNQPALILLDLFMPEMDGFTFVEEMQKYPAKSTIPIVVMTGKDLTGEERQRLQGGVHQILQKGSFTHKQFERVIHGVTGRSTHQEAS